MQTKPFTLVVCPDCGSVHAIDKDEYDFYCKGCRNWRYIKYCYKLGLKTIEETGETIWVGVKEE